MKTFKRNLVVVFFVLFNSVLFAQSETNSVKIFKEVVKVDSTLTANELYSRAKIWLVETYKSAKDVLQIEDKENGKIVGKANMKYYSKIFTGSEGTKGWISYTISIYVKDGRFKYEINNFIHEGNPYNSGGQFSFGLITDDQECPYKIGNIMCTKSWHNKVWTDLKNHIDYESNQIISSLKEAMLKEKSKNDNNW